MHPPNEEHPIAPRVRETLDATAVASCQPGVVSFLVIDDDASVRALVRMAASLSDLVECVGEAEDGETGLALVRNTPADVALLDFDLPDMRGDRIAQLLFEEGIVCQVVLHSGHGPEGQLPRGVADWIVKDGDMDALFAAVRKAAMRS